MRIRTVINSIFVLIKIRTAMECSYMIELPVLSIYFRNNITRKWETFFLLKQSPHWNTICYAICAISVLRNEIKSWFLQTARHKCLSVLWYVLWKVCQYSVDSYLVNLSSHGRTWPWFFNWRRFELIFGNIKPHSRSLFGDTEALYSWISFSWKTNTYVSVMVNIIAAGNQGVREYWVMPITYFFFGIFRF